MAKYWKYMGLYDAETKTLTEFGSGAYTPEDDGKLIAIRPIVGAASATALIEAFRFQLTHSKFQPNAIDVGGVGNGLATVPAYKSAPVDWPVDQQIKGGLPIKLEGQNLTGDTPVGVEIYLFGYFST